MLSARGLVRRFGDAVVLDGVDLDVLPGRMTGFVGANGAGKTTTMRILLGVLAPSAGEVRWDGRPVTAADRRDMGYMPEERGLYPKQRVAEQLVHLGRLHGLGTQEARESVGSLLERLDLAGRADDRLDSLSLGNQQRVQVAAALVHGPSALVLDEPFSGLDPLAVDAMAALLREEVARGVPVLFSSHQLDLVERLCDDVVVLAQGRRVAAGTVPELRARGGARTRLEVGPGAGGDVGDLGWLRDVAGVDVLDVDGPRALFTAAEPGADQRVLAEALRRGPVRAFAPDEPSLSEVFREVVR
ncbi:ABC transporter ATP-binding protein [uncultured Pseudokineococcus sp.]|uniref:ABC transporter ATP-binding protein n=1 Tax=uncultured Pseudokineococcus sp. TaxID=1642928 RepID=UPI00262879EC|nr:ATP-binding cassette domain-containing protein [uncultured Pseudokineococcus sp.]